MVPKRRFAGVRPGVPVQAFYAFAVVYLAIALWAAQRAGRQVPSQIPGQVPGQIGRRTGRFALRRQRAILVAVLEAGLLWPERWRALLASFWDDPSIG
jgi:hypothetical protein